MYFLHSCKIVLLSSIIIQFFSGILFRAAYSFIKWAFVLISSADIKKGDASTSDGYVKFKINHNKYKTKVIQRSSIHITAKRRIMTWKAKKNNTLVDFHRRIL